MDGSGGEGAAGAGGLAAWIPPAPPGPGACEVPHVAHRASHIVACVCGRACVVCVCVCVSVRACVRACSGARGVRSSPSPVMPFVGRRAPAPLVTPPLRTPSAPSTG